MTRSVLAIPLLVIACASPPATVPDRRVASFEREAEQLRAQLRIPGMSAVILENQHVLLARGFGYADYEGRVPAAADTVYHVASITKVFAATLVLGLVEQGKLDLEAPMSRYSADFKDDAVRVKHLLNHTSGAPVPGERYEYDGQRYDYLAAVVEKTTGKSFRAAMEETILAPLGMRDSAPDPRVVDAPGARYAPILAKQSVPYTLYGDDEIIRVPYPIAFFGAAAGLLSTVGDMARFDIAIDTHALLRKETQERAWTPTLSNSGARLPYGLGWHVEDYHGVRIIWHGGNWGRGFSAIYVKVPAKNVSLVMLSNSEALNGHLYEGGRRGHRERRVRLRVPPRLRVRRCGQPGL